MDWTFRQVSMLGILLLIFFFFLSPQTGDALKPLDEKSLEELSPPLKVVEDSTSKQTRPKPIPEDKFSGSVCFVKCHTPGSIDPSNYTMKQWRLLIEQDGHDVFDKIPWKNKTEKEQIYLFLIQHASDARRGSEGIGVW